MSHYLLVVDLEATCCDKRTIPRKEMEIIEIGAVIVSTDGYVPVSEFQTFIRPVRNPVLTQFCQELTSITQEEVENAPGFIEAMHLFTKWADEYTPYTFCSWGNYDRGQFLQDCQHHSIEYPLGAEHINLKSKFANALGLSKKVGLAKAIKMVNQPFVGVHHRGIDDARNIASLLPHIYRVVDNA